MKTLLITGASSDIGLALIEAVAESYDNIIAHYRSSHKRFEALSEEARAKVIPVQADFSDESSVTAMIESIKAQGLQPDSIVHLASAPMENKHFKKQSWEDFSDSLSLSLQPIISILQAFLPAMAKAKSGRIIFMLTSCVVGMPPKYKSVYTTTKYAALGLMKSLAVEYADKGITVNAVSPEMIDTRFVADLPDIVRQMAAESMPQKRNLAVGEVVPAFTYLLSDGAAMVSGQNIVISDSTC